MEVPKPEPKANEVRIRVHASTVNRTDCGFRSANYFIVRFFSGLFRPKRKVLGCEFAGEIDAIGKEVSQFRVGERVFGFNDTHWGAHAEYMVLPETAAMATVPEGWDFERAAPLTEGAHYALCNIRAAKITAGQQVLVNGGTGAIGSAAIQLLKDLGAEVTAVCATPQIDLVKSLGADTVIDYTREDFTRLGKHFDVVFDAVGKSTFGQCKLIMKPKGIYMSTELGPGSQNIFLAMATPLLRGKRVLFPMPLVRREDIQLLKELAESGKFNPVIDRVYPLSDIVEAYRYVETGMKTGNVVLRVKENL
jgi:NADPH:quinone reductase-like Zn-dependent oxidoreductase